MELVKRIFLLTAGKKRAKEITKQQFLKCAQDVSQMSPLQVQILFELCEVMYNKKGLVQNNLDEIAPESYFKRITTIVDGPPGGGGKGVLNIIFEILYHFGLGFLAGGTGAAAVFPVDLVKTRIQNQRAKPGEADALYRGYIDCFIKVVRNEGFFGLYKGLLPQLCGVSPEKAIKLTVNDFVRDKFYDENGYIPYAAELLAGGCAGISQVVVTNPLEIIKIRLQTAGEVAGGHKIKAREVIRNLIKELGITGLYRGIRACIPRDITFAAIYFSTYANGKLWLSDSSGYNTPLSLLAAGTLAGVPAAALATPFDVIKTRLQVIPRPGQQTYDGVVDAARKIYAQEGLKAFGKGVLARVCRSSPQLGITLFTYELLQRFFPATFRKQSGGTCKDCHPDHIGGYSLAVPVFAGIETKFGIALPRFRVPPAN